MIRTLQDYDDSGGFYSLSSDALENLKTALGQEELTAWNNNRKEAVDSIWDIIKGGDPHHVFNAIEAFIDVIADISKLRCQEDINQSFAMFNQQWRIANGQFFKIDSEYMAEIIDLAVKLLSQSGFVGPQQEFLEAREAYTEGDYKETIINSNKALESAIKAVLNVNKGRSDKLIKDLMKSKIIPNYYEGFLTALSSIFNIVPVQRHQPGAAHGQGKEIVDFPESLAELALHLTGSLIVFMIKRYIEVELHAKQPIAESENMVLAEDIPF